MPQNPRKPKYQLDLLDEKRAFVVIALTDRLNQSGKLVAMNALAHYNSERGYSWASVPVIAAESGYSVTSTKTINAGLNEVEEVGAFKIVRTKGGGAKNTHRICPIIPWFRAEYDRLRETGRIEYDNDEFADVRSEAFQSGSEPRAEDNTEGRRVQDCGQSGSKPGSVGSKTLVSRVQDPTNRTDETNREKRTNLNDNAHACGSRVPAVDLHVKCDAQTKAANDNEDVNESQLGDADSRTEDEPSINERRNEDSERNEQGERRRKAGEGVWDMLHKAPPRQHDEFIELFVRMALAGEIRDLQAVRYGLKCYLNDTPREFHKAPIKLLKEKVWETYRQPKGSPWDGLYGSKPANRRLSRPAI